MTANRNTAARDHMRRKRQDPAYAAAERKRRRERRALAAVVRRAQAQFAGSLLRLFASPEQRA